jgi:hypothetical protein
MTTSKGTNVLGGAAGEVLLWAVFDQQLIEKEEVTAWKGGEVHARLGFGAYLSHN